MLLHSFICCRFSSVSEMQNKLEKVAINDALPLDATRRDAIAKLKSFSASNLKLQTNPIPFHLDSLWGATLMPLTACEKDWGQNRILRVGKTPVLF